VAWPEHTDDSARGGRFDRRRFLSGVGASGLTAAAAIFGFSQSASAKRRPLFKMCSPGTFIAGCCCLCCPPAEMNECETGNFYVWSCTKATLTCECCERGNACFQCDSNNFSGYSCT
jgi:hypothetical protein